MILIYRSLNKFFFVSVLCLLISIVTYGQQKQFIVDIEPEEEWWCGIVSRGTKMPLNSSSTFFFDMKFNDCNQVQPLLMSNQGRVVWNNEPFTVEFKGKKIILNGTGDFLVKKKGKTLRDAQKYARDTWFPPSGSMPDELLFSKPQYNTWIELNFNQNQTDILKYAHAIVDNGLPVGVLMIDDSWQQNFGIWKFRNDRFPDPKAMVDELHALGFKVMLWIVPFISPDCLAFLPLLNKEKILIMDESKPSHPLFIKWWEGYSAEIDFTNPNGMKWFLQQLNFLQNTYNIDGFKFDAGDFDRFPSNSGTFKKVSGNEHNSIYASIGLKYPLNEYRATWKLGGQALAQRLCDKEHTWQDLRKVIPEMLVIGLAGYPFACPDMIGGGEISSFASGAKIDQDLIVRSAQCQALMPMMQFSVAPWRILDKAHMNAIKDAVNIRNKLSSLIIQLAKIAATNGEPIVKPLEYVFPAQNLLKIADQFLLGDSLMVTPLMEKDNYQRTVKFPILKKGKWISDDGKVYKGGTVAVINVPLNRLPYFIIRK